MKILIIEDYEPSAAVTKMYLDHHGYDCHIAEGGLEALEKFRESHYDAVLMDIKMSDLDGYKTTEAIRQYEKEFSRPPAKIIGVTGLSHPKDREKCLETGMNDYLCKPFDLFELREMLTSV